MIDKVKILVRKKGEALTSRQAILDKALNENRGLSDAERAESVRLKQAAEDCDDQIAFYRQVMSERGDGDALRDLTDGMSHISLEDPVPGGPGESRKEPTGPEFVNVQTGEKIRSLRPKDSYYRSRDFNLPDGIKASELSLGRLLRAAYTGNWKEAGAELRVMGGGSGATGGYLLPEPMSAMVIDQVRNSARVIEAGALQIPMQTNKIGLARVKKDPESSWVGENQKIPSSDLNFDLGTMEAYKNAIIVKLSEELFQDATNLETLVLEFPPTSGHRI